MVNRLTLNEIDGRRRSVVPSFASAHAENFTPHASKARYALIQKKHAFLDPRGWSIIPRPALHETSVPRRVRASGELDEARFAESLLRLCIGVRRAQGQGLQFVDSLQAWVTCQDELWQ